MAYVPSTPPVEMKEWPRWLAEEHQRISASLSSPVPGVQFDTLHAEPKKPRPGLVVCADGADWNPGSGAGHYSYRGGAWHFLG